MNQDYLGEVATKLRLLTSEWGRNEPLLLRLMDECGHDQMATSLRASLASHTYGTETLSTGQVVRTGREIIEAWAAQHGAAHEDWEISEEFSGAFATDDVGFYPTLAVILLGITREVVGAAEQFLARATPEVIAAAEAKRQRRDAQ